MILGDGTTGANGGARAQVVFFARNGGVYASRNLTQLDFSLWSAADRFIRGTKSLPVVSQLMLANNVSSVLPSGSLQNPASGTITSVQISVLDLTTLPGNYVGSVITLGNVAGQSQSLTITGYTPATKTVTFTSTLMANTYTSYSISLPQYFRPDRLLAAYLTGSNVQVQINAGLDPGYLYDTIGAPINWGINYAYASAFLKRMDYNWLLDLSISRQLNRQPAIVAFDQWTTGMVYPTPDDNYVLNIRWMQFFTQWTFGATDSGTNATILNLPQDMLTGILMWGAPGYLLSNEPEHQDYGKYCMEKFEAFIEQYAGAGNLGEELIQPDPVRR